MTARIHDAYSEAWANRLIAGEELRRPVYVRFSVVRDHLRKHGYGLDSCKRFAPVGRAYRTYFTYKRTETHG